MKKTILIVDFEQKAIEEMQQILQDEDFHLLTASDGSQALEMFESRNPDLVLTTALLPKLNGFELCKKITSGERGEVRPVVIYSEIYKAEKYRKEAVIGCGAMEFLDKPIPKWQLLKVIRSAFSEIPLGKIIEASPVPATVANSDTFVLALDEPESAGASLTEDLLGVDTLFEDSEPAPTAAIRDVDVEPFLLEAPLPESKASLISGIENAEIDAAVDAFRIDLEKEVRERDDHAAAQFEQELLRAGQGILEFESALEKSPEVPLLRLVDDESPVFELDAVEINAAPVGDAGPLELSEETNSDQTAEASQAVPTFSMKSTESRNWPPLLFLAAFVVLASLFWWFAK